MAAGIATRIDKTSTTLPPIVLGNIAQAAMVEIRDQRNVTVLSGEFRSTVDLLGNTEKDAALIDRRGQRVIGEVELEIPAKSRTDRRPELEVDILGLPPRQTFRSSLTIAWSGPSSPTIAAAWIWSFRRVRCRSLSLEWPTIRSIAWQQQTRHRHRLPNVSDPGQPVMNRACVDGGELTMNSAAMATSQPELRMAC